MKIIERYICKEFTKSFLYCLAVFIFLYIMADLFNYIDEMIHNRVAVKTVFIYYATFVPKIFVDITPIAVLLSTVYILSVLNRHNEITVLRASGISLWKIIRPLLVVGFVLSLFVFIVNDKIVPPSLIISSKIRKEEIRETKKKKTKSKILKDIAIYGTKNRLIYVRYFDTQKNILKEIIILEHDKNQTLISKSSAQEAHWKKNKWIFHNFSTYRLNSKGDIIGNPIFFEKKAFDLDESPEDFKRLQWRTEFMNYKELRDYITRFSGTGLRAVGKLLVDLYYKISFAFISLVVIVLATPLALISNRGGILIGIGISILVVLSYYAISAISIALGKSGAIPPLVSAWMAHVIFLGLGIYLMRKKQ